jgi:translation initiation factor 2 beta subunit (eIF-2beta)/eIF-5
MKARKMSAVMKLNELVLKRKLQPNNNVSKTNYSYQSFCKCNCVQKVLTRMMTDSKRLLYYK